jgi:hypothetical protein
MAPPSSKVSDEAATGEPERTRHAPSHPTPRALQALSVKIEPSSDGIRERAPSFITPRAVTNSARPARASSTRDHHGRPAPPTCTSGTGAWWKGPGPVPVTRDSGEGDASPLEVSGSFMVGRGVSVGEAVGSAHGALTR